MPWLDGVSRRDRGERATPHVVLQGQRADPLLSDEKVLLKRKQFVTVSRARKGLPPAVGCHVGRNAADGVCERERTLELWRARCVSRRVRCAQYVVVKPDLHTRRQHGSMP